MQDKKTVEEINKEMENSTSDVQNIEEKKPKGSGIFTVDGKELPEIEGGYDIINPGGNLADDDFVSV